VIQLFYSDSAGLAV